MYFSQEFWIGVSFACIGAGGMALSLSRQKHPPTDVRGQRNKKENLKDDNDKFFDAESRSFQSMSDEESRIFRSVSDENLNDNTTHVKSIGELYMDAVDKRAFRYMQRNFQVCEMKCLALENYVADAMYTVHQTVDSLRLEVSHLKKDLNRLTAVNLLKNSETTSAERNYEKSEEKPDSCKLRRLKTRVLILESDVTKNSTEISGLNHTLMLRLMRLVLGSRAKVTSAGENTPNAQCHQPDAPTSGSFTPAAGPPLPPPSAVTSADFEPPPAPPSPPMTTGTVAFCRDHVQKPCAPVEARALESEDKEVKTYCRVPITEEDLRSVVLKPVARQT